MFTKMKNYLDKSRESREQIKQFNKLFSSYLSGSDIGMRFCAYLFDFLGIIIMFIPCQELYSPDSKNTSLLFITFLFLSYSTFFYLDSYLQFRERGKLLCLFQKLSYIPVDKTDLRVVILGYLFRYKKKVFPLMLLAQFTGALLSYHRLSPANFLYCLLCGVLLPFSIAAFQLRRR